MATTSDMNKGDNTKADDGIDTSGVVMRRPKITFDVSNNDNDNDNVNRIAGGGGRGLGGERDSARLKSKTVTWSESTEVREKMKVYRRSQLDVSLDYHHIAVEEEREREGVRTWRRSLSQVSDEEDSQKDEEGTRAAPDVVDDDDEGVEVEGEDEVTPSCEQTEFTPSLEEDLEKKLQVIKGKTKQYTVYPAYCAAVPVYTEWLSNSRNTKELSDDRKSAMTSQLEMFQKIIDLYKDWVEKDGDDDTDEDENLRFYEIASLLQEADDIITPPPCVSTLVEEILTDEENIKKEEDAYNEMLQNIIMAQDSSGKM